jgi:hypothetical protein
MSIDPNRWEEIYSTDQEYKIVIATQVLADEEIVSRYINQKDSAYHFGFFVLYVRPDDVIKAKHLIEKAKL